MRQPRFAAHARMVAARVLAEHENRFAVFGKKFGGGALRSRFIGDRFHAVFAELERRMRVAVGPHAARAVEPGGLIGAQQRARSAQHRVLLAQRLPRGFQRVPAAGGFVVGLDRCVVVAISGHFDRLAQRRPRHITGSGSLDAANAASVDCRLGRVGGRTGHVPPVVRTP